MGSMGSGRVGRRKKRSTGAMSSHVGNGWKGSRGGCLRQEAIVGDGLFFGALQDKGFCNCTLGEAVARFSGRGWRLLHGAHVARSTKRDTCTSQCEGRFRTVQLGTTSTGATVRAARACTNLSYLGVSTNMPLPVDPSWSRPRLRESYSSAAQVPNQPMELGRPSS